MPVPGRGLIAILLLAMVSAPTAAQARQCTCGPLSDAQAVEQADYVFTARVIAPVELLIPDGSAPADGWSFVVTGVAKGQVPPEQLVAVPTASDECSIDFDRETEYVVFATDERADLPAAVVAVDACGGTRPSSEPVGVDLVFAEAQPIVVDPDSFPVVADPLEQRAEGDVLTRRAVVVVGGIIGATALAAWWLWRTRPET